MNTLDEILNAAATDLQDATQRVKIPLSFPGEDFRARTGVGGSTAMGTRRVLIAAAVVAVIAGGLVIIKRPGSTSDSPTIIPARTTTTTTRPLVGPPPGGDLFDFSIYKGDFFAVLEVAEWNRSLECMNSRGFELPSLPLPMTRVLLYGMPEGTDTSHGFRMPVPNSNPSPLPGLTTEEHIALNGPNDSETRTVSLPTGEAGVTLRGGCVGESQRALYGSAELFFEAMTLFFTLQDEDVRMIPSLESSPAMRALNEEWAACMSAAGFQFSTPLQAWSFGWPEETTSEEIAAATADVECKTAMDYTNRADAVGHEIAALMPQSVNDLLARWFELSAEILERAAPYAPASTSSSEITNLYQLFGLSTEQSFVLRRAIDIETGKCMGARGLEYAVDTEVVDTTPVPTVPTAEEVELYGYMWRVRRFEQRSDETQRRTLGADEQDCASEAMDVLSMDARNATADVISSAASEITQRALSDPSYLATVDDWRECLQAFGYPVEQSPTNASVAESLPGGAESAEGIRMAVRDYACQEQVGLNATLEQLIATATKAWLDDNPTVVAEYRRLQAELLDRAQGVTG